MRPLSLGELADRTVTLCVRRWAAFFAIAFVCAIPVLIIETLQLLGELHGLDTLETLIMGVTSAASSAATSILVAQIYKSEAAQWTTALARGARKILAIFGLNLLVGFALLLPAIAIYFTMLGLWMLAKGNTVALVAVELVPAAAALALVMLAFFVQLVGTSAIAIDDRGPSSALSKAWQFFFRGKRFAFSAVLSIAAIYLGGVMIFAIAAGLLPGTNDRVISFATTLALLIFAIVANVAGAVLYLDLRIRYEGFDIENSLDNLHAEGAPA